MSSIISSYPVLTIITIIITSISGNFWLFCNRQTVSCTMSSKLLIFAILLLLVLWVSFAAHVVPVCLLSQSNGNAQCLRQRMTEMNAFNVMSVHTAPDTDSQPSSFTLLPNLSHKRIRFTLSQSQSHSPGKDNWPVIVSSFVRIYLIVKLKWLGLISNLWYSNFPKTKDSVGGWELGLECYFLHPK